MVRWGRDNSYGLILGLYFRKKISRKMIQAKVAQNISGPEECRIYRSKYWPIGRPLVRCIQKFLIPLLTSDNSFFGKIN